MSKKKLIAGVIVFAVLLAAVLYFLLPVKMLDADEVEHVSIAVSGERKTLEGDELSEVTALLDDMRTRRCFAPAELYDDDTAMELDIVTSDGPLHIVLSEKSYAYSSTDDTIWYSVIDADQLRSDIERAIA